VSTSSTRSSASKKGRSSKPGGATGDAARDDVQASPFEDIPERVWLIAAITIFCVAAILRLYDLNLVPLHHDEGVNGNFLLALVRDGRYQYDPANYHGPTLYYFAAVIPWTLNLLFGTGARETYGLNTIAIRLVPALFGLATIWLVYLLRPRLGSVATLSAALLLAISPGSVYLSRYFIHETLFVFFTLGTVVAGLRFYERQNPVYLMLAAMSAALLFATKETAMISAAVLIIAFATTQIYLRVYEVAFSNNRSNAKRARAGAEGLHIFLKGIGGTPNLLFWIALGILVFFVINVLFYSSFFHNYPKGIYDALKTFDFWTKTGKEAHVHPLLTYLTWLRYQESPLLILGILGAIFILLRPKNSFALFSALWAFGLIAAYSLVPYKTPWLTLNFIIPLALIAGYSIQWIYEIERKQLRLPVAILSLAVGINIYQTIDLNFFNYDNDDTYYVYVYAHTRRGAKKLVEEIHRLAQQGPDGWRTGITIVSPDYWPLPWYLRNYNRVGYFGRMTQSTEPIIIASETQRAEVESTFGERYRLVPSGESSGGFGLRPGVNLFLYVKRTNWQQ
jgi:uncharacterized protein (TIGR03663 family)